VNTSFYLDTSALVKLYHQEVGTERMEDLFRQEENVLVISELAIIEFYATLARKVRIGRSLQRPRRKPTGTSRQTASSALLLLRLAVLPFRLRQSCGRSVAGTLSIQWLVVSG